MNSLYQWTIDSLMAMHVCVADSRIFEIHENFIFLNFGHRNLLDLENKFKNIFTSNIVEFKNLKGMRC